MKLLRGEPFDRLRDTSPQVIAHYGSAGNELCGCFHLRDGLWAIASAGDGWDHVSVSHQRRCPTWEEMVYVRRLFFKPDEWVVEYHPPESKNISLHQFCLHLWRPQLVTLPIPPSYMVA